MSIEYFGVPSPALTVNNIHQLVDSIAEFDDILLVRRDEFDLGISLPENDNSNQETATIVLKHDEVYIAFHACHKNQRDRVIYLVESILKEIGCVCQLEEN